MTIISSSLQTFKNFFRNIVGPPIRVVGRYLKKYLFTQKNKPIILTAIVFVLMGSVLSDVANTDIVIFSILGISIMIILLYDLQSKYVFMLCLLLLAIMFIQFLLTGPSVNTEKTAVWLYLFIGVGIVKQWIE